MMIAFIVILAMVAVGALVVAHGASVKSKWGMDPGTITCPYCHAELPAFRWPSSLRQALLGGWTCSICTTKVDKWGREIGHDPVPRLGGKAS
jgi:hypothetical protein